MSCSTVYIIASALFKSEFIGDVPNVESYLHALWQGTAKFIWCDFNRWESSVSGSVQKMLWCTLGIRKRPAALDQSIQSLKTYILGNRHYKPKMSAKHLKWCHLTFKSACNINDSWECSINRRRDCNKRRVDLFFMHFAWRVATSQSKTLENSFFTLEVKNNDDTHLLYKAEWWFKYVFVLSWCYQNNLRIPKEKHYFGRPKGFVFKSSLFAC